MENINKNTNGNINEKIQMEKISKNKIKEKNRYVWKEKRNSKFNTAAT